PATLRSLPPSSRSSSVDVRHLHSFPTRRSSDLGGDMTQTSLWTRLKRASGMRTHRVVLRIDGVIAGGAQLLARPVPVLGAVAYRSEEHTSELQSHLNLVCRLLLEQKKTTYRLLP